MEASKHIIDELFVDKVLAARNRAFEEKFLAAGELFEAVIERMRAGILLQRPQASESEIASEIHRRLTIARTLENQP